MHALVVGGTGMLKDVCLSLNKQNWLVSVVARDPIRMNALTNQAAFPEKIKPLLVDWTNIEAFIKTIEHAIDEHGPIELVVYWSSHDALPSFLEWMGGHNEKTWDFYHIKGSRASRPESRNIPDVPCGCHYHEVILGFQMEGETTRWLTHEEIATGVFEAITENLDQKIIGTVEPWELRPSW